MNLFLKDTFTESKEKVPLLRKHFIEDQLYDTSRMTINITIAAMSTQRSFLFKQLIQILGEFDEGIEVQKITRLKYARNEAIQLCIWPILIQITSRELLRNSWNRSMTRFMRRKILIYLLSLKKNFKILFLFLMIKTTEVVWLRSCCTHDAKTFSTDNKLIEFILSYKNITTLMSLYLSRKVRRWFFYVDMARRGNDKNSVDDCRKAGQYLLDWFYRRDVCDR